MAGGGGCVRARTGATSYSGKSDAARSTHKWHFNIGIHTVFFKRCRLQFRSFFQTLAQLGLTASINQDIKFVQHLSLFSI